MGKGSTNPKENDLVKWVNECNVYTVQENGRQANSKEFWGQEDFSRND